MGCPSGFRVARINSQQLQLITFNAVSYTHLDVYKRQSPSLRLIVPELFGEVAVIHLAEIFPPIQPILGNPDEYTRNI